MATKPYELDSPYRNLTINYDEDFICKQNRLRRKNKCLTCLAGMAVFICVTACIISAVSAIYCMRASNRVRAIEAELINKEAEADRPFAEALKRFDIQDERDIDEDLDTTDDEWLEDSADVDDEEDYDDNNEDDDADDDNENQGVSEDSDVGNDEFIDLDSASGIGEGGEDSVDEGYVSDDEDDGFIEGSGLEDSKVAKLRKRRETSTPEPKQEKKDRKQKKNRKNRKNRKDKSKGKQKGKKQQREKITQIMDFLPAAQFDGSVDDETIRKHCKEYSKIGGQECVHVKDMEGMLCNNKSFFPDNKNKALKILKPESWVEKGASPVTLKDSILTVKSSGVYLVYAQVLFSGYEATKSASAVVTRNGTEQQILSCNADMSTNHLVLEEVPEKNQHTCSIFGMLQLKADDQLELRTGNAHAPIERVQGATYFGIVQINNKS